MSFSITHVCTDYSRHIHRIRLIQVHCNLFQLVQRLEHHASFSVILCKSLHIYAAAYHEQRLAEPLDDDLRVNTVFYEPLDVLQELAG